MNLIPSIIYITIDICRRRPCGIPIPVGCNAIKTMLAICIYILMNTKILIFTWKVKPILHNIIPRKKSPIIGTELITRCSKNIDTRFLCSKHYMFKCADENFRMIFIPFIIIKVIPSI